VKKFPTHKMNDKWRKYFFARHVHILLKLLLHFVNAFRPFFPHLRPSVEVQEEKTMLVNYPPPHPKARKAPAKAFHREDILRCYFRSPFLVHRVNSRRVCS
jgi:hypothetical protein